MCFGPFKKKGIDYYERELRSLSPRSLSAKKRKQTASSLGKVKDPRAVELLVSALKDTESEVRQAAVHSLGRLGYPTVVQPLISALRDRASEVREAAVYFLGRLGDPACVEALARTLEDNDSDVRAAAADSLIELGDTRGMDAGLASVERILRMLDDPNEEDPNLTVAVEIFGTYRYGVELLNYGVKEHPDEEVRRLAALVLSCTTSPLTWAAKPKGDEAFCLKCRTKQKIKNPAPVVLKSGLCTRGTCPKCGTKVYRIDKDFTH